MKNETNDGLGIGSPAPDFTLADGDGREWHLSEQRGRVVVLLFYPGDETPVCTRQMCSVRDRWEDYREAGAEVVGISMDTADSHRRFAEHHQLPLRLLSDADGRVSRAYGALSWLPGRSARAVVIVGRDGRLRYRKVQPLSLFRPNDDRIIEEIKKAHEAEAGSQESESGMKDD
ncbi:MAG TPA: peroxiredoxin [Pyrinomonadaceae bacterium]|nr:peroxiredoxin [Pyrinomonadaceae bacterium]